MDAEKGVNTSPPSVDYGDGDEEEPSAAEGPDSAAASHAVPAETEIETPETQTGGAGAEGVKDLRGLQKEEAVQVPAHVLWPQRSSWTSYQDGGSQEPPERGGTQLGQPTGPGAGPG